MLNAVYRLISPRRFEIFFDNIDITPETIIVRPKYLSICNADQRYYQGNRDPKALKEKLPMALIHEGIGEIIYDNTGSFIVGQQVVMIPNVPIEEDSIIAENYLRSSKFRSSGLDGFLQDYIITTKDRLIALPDSINLKVAAFTELVSVSMHTITRINNFSNSNHKIIGVWGDGNLGYITSLLFKTLMPETKIVIVGKDQEKLSNFTFADRCYLVTELPTEIKVDHAIECVGGMYAENAINQIIDHIHPEGTIALLGVSEMNVNINTRMILEKGLRLFGSSRSGRSDFIKTIDVFNKHPEVVKYLETIVSTIIPIYTMEDITKAFEADIKKMMGKTLLEWKI